MAEKKDLDAPKPAPPSTQAAPKRDEISLTKRREVFEAVEKAVKKPQ